jgi:ubiquinone/menaquinone biosynthesis C-methylase UbiE
MASERTLSRADVEAVYDRTGAWQDMLALYKGPALNALVARGAFETARSLFEIGCGTGRFAHRLLREHCPPEAEYRGVDLSDTMVRLARDRLAPMDGRATVRKTDGGLTFEAPDGAYDRIVATYLLDLLPQGDIHTLLGESHRLLGADGRLCVAGLTWGRGLLARGVSTGWKALHAVFPRWVGGCRPLRVRALLDERRWRVEHHSVVTGWGVPSEVLVARPG